LLTQPTADPIRLVPRKSRPAKETAAHPAGLRAFAAEDGLVAPAPGVVQPSHLAWADPRRGLFVYHGDSFEVMDALAAKHPEGCFDLIFADPPYFLSNGGITCHAGKMVKVDKGAWDKSRGPEENHNFNREWLRRCQALLKPHGTLFVSGTHHVIFSVGFALQELGMKLLNQITWQKPNPPPNLACRYFTHSTETVLWAAKNARSRHVFHYAEMKRENGGKQMKDVWSFTAPKSGEKALGRHPTQKPLALLERLLRAASREGGSRAGSVSRQRHDAARRGAASPAVRRNRKRFELRPVDAGAGGGGAAAAGRAAGTAGSARRALTGTSLRFIRRMASRRP
jgi:site-specific DNA-methyltransferase (adenine-specific)